MDYEYTPLDFIAGQLAAKNHEPRWWCLRDDIRAKYIEKAKALVLAWASEEQAAKARTIEEAGF